MKIKKILFAAILLMATQAFAQVSETETDQCYRQVYKSKVPLWLNLSLGWNETNTYDNGTVPYRYAGIGVNLGYGATIEWKRCHIQNESRMFLSMFTAFDGYAIDLDSRTEFLYRCYDSKRNHFHLWAGGSVQYFYDIKSISSLLNASTGISGFFNIRAEGKVQYDFAFIRNGSHNLLSLYGKVGLPAASYVIRPGYAYLDNYTGSLNTSNTILQDYESFTKLFPGVSTDIGLYINLLNGNRIGFCYRWDYLTTGHKGIYRYDNAIHSFNVNLMFNIN